jgi:ribosomal protein S18 acetylase RimI-like enzyme
MTTPLCRPAERQDIDALLDIEQRCFTSDRLTRRRFVHWQKARNGILLVCVDDTGMLGYGLVILHKGTRLSRLYSLAVSPDARGKGVAKHLLSQLETDTAARERLYMRLEVAKTNTGAIGLYESMGYRVFDEYHDYYEDHTDALRMQKLIRKDPGLASKNLTPWYQQTTDFTCGPASLMMAMASLDPEVQPAQAFELDLWREATTIFMTSGHGGCHPVGLAVAAQRRGYQTTTYINCQKPLFIEGVRTAHKKDVMIEVDKQFHQRAAEVGATVVFEDITQDAIQTFMDQGCAVLILISTYRMDGKKTPHWVCVTGMDDVCLYVNDPDIDDQHQVAMDCQHIPIARDDFAKMSSFGSERLRTAIILEPKS